jgi:hypothetical protein
MSTIDDLAEDYLSPETRDRVSAFAAELREVPEREREPMRDAAERVANREDVTPGVRAMAQVRMGALDAMLTGEDPGHRIVLAFAMMEANTRAAMAGEARGRARALHGRKRRR